MTFAWTLERLDRLENLWRANELTTKEIGRCLGTTKGAVIGKAHYLGLPKKASPIKKDDNVRRCQREGCDRVLGLLSRSNRKYCCENCSVNSKTPMTRKKSEPFVKCALADCEVTVQGRRFCSDQCRSQYFSKLGHDGHQARWVTGGLKKMKEVPCVAVECKHLALYPHPGCYQHGQPQT